MKELCVTVSSFIKSVVQIQNLPNHCKGHYEVILNLKFKSTKYPMLILRMEYGEIFSVTHSLSNQTVCHVGFVIKDVHKWLCVHKHTSLSSWPTFLTAPRESKHAATGPVLHQLFLQLVLQVRGDPNKSSDVQLKSHGWLSYGTLSSSGWHSLSNASSNSGYS